MYDGRHLPISTRPKQQIFRAKTQGSCQEGGSIFECRSSNDCRGAAIASSIQGARAQTSLEDSASKGAVRNAKKWRSKIVKDQRRFPKLGVFEKALKAIAALVASIECWTWGLRFWGALPTRGLRFGGTSSWNSRCDDSISSSKETLNNPCMNHEFLLDAGAGRNLIPNQGLPNDLKPFVMLRQRRWTLQLVVEKGLVPKQLN